MSEARLIGNIDKFTLEEKRVYIPGLVIEADCPNCGCVIQKDCENDYLSYPVVNGAEMVYMGECLCGGTEEHGCYAEVEVPLLLTLTADLAGPACRA